MCNNYGEFESGLAVLLVHVQTSMLAKKLASSKTVTVQHMMRSLTELEKTKTSGALNLEELHEIEQHIEKARSKLTALMHSKTEETKTAPIDAETKLLEEGDTGCSVNRIAGKPFHFDEYLFASGTSELCT